MTLDDTLCVNTVLVVEDEEALREVCRDMLDAFGYRTLLAASGEEAVQLVNQYGNEIDCVLLDLTMPGMNGVETYNTLRAIHPELQVIITSGHDAGDVLDEFPVSGVADYVQKPYGMRELHEKLQRLFQSR
ncbi:MAG: response regulator [Caldilinea sp.]